jgi:TolB protein
MPTSATLPIAQVLPLSDGGTIAGKILFQSGGDLMFWSDGRTRALTSGGTWRQPQWSPDGAEIAYVYQGKNFSDIFIMKADGSENHRLTRSQSTSLSDNDWSFRPTWSPDGRQIAYVSDSDSYNPTVRLINRDGTGRRQISFGGSLTDAADALSWSPDGTRLAVTAFNQTTSQIVLVEIGRGNLQIATESSYGALDPAWSPDGSALAYGVRDTARMEIRLRRLDGSPEVEVTRGSLSRAPTWSPDGTQLAYLSARGGSFELYVVDVVNNTSGLSVKNERQLTRDLNIDAPSGLSWDR